MRILLFSLTVLLIGVAFSGCGEIKEETPFNERDFISTIVANHYYAEPVSIDEEDGLYHWVIKTTNNSGYAWKGEMTIYLVNSEMLFQDEFQFTFDELIQPGETTDELKFSSEHNIASYGGDITSLKIEVNVVDYISPKDIE